MEVPKFSLRGGKWGKGTGVLGKRKFGKKRAMGKWREKQGEGRKEGRGGKWDRSRMVRGGKKIFRFLENPCEFVCFLFIYIHYFLSGEDNSRKMIMIKSRFRSVNLCYVDPTPQKVGNEIYSRKPKKNISNT